MKIKFIVDNEQKKITFYFSEKYLHGLAKICMKHGIPSEKASELIASKLEEIIDMAGKIVGKDLINYTPDMEVLKEKKYSKLQPTRDMDIMLIKEATKNDIGNTRTN